MAVMRSSRLAHPGPSVGRIAYAMGRIYLWLAGWDVVGDPPTVRQGVFIAAPHTSNWDMPFMIACAFVYRLKPSWAGKRVLFRWPWGWFMRWMGGIAVDRSGKKNTVGQLVDQFKHRERLCLGIAPSGTRSKTEYWKSGFYHIARQAGVPILCGYLDYGRKIGGLGPVIHPSGDIRADMDRIRTFYADIQGRRPELKSAIRLKGEPAEEKGDEE